MGFESSAMNSKWFYVLMFYVLYLFLCWVISMPQSGPCKDTFGREERGNGDVIGDRQAF
jgi:hypothetical protein